MERKYIIVCVLFVLFGTTVQGGKKEGWTADDVWCATKKYGGGVLLGAGTVAVVPHVLGAIGFGPAGIVAGGTIAATAMAFSAAANGAAGLGIGSKAIIGVTSGGIYSYLVGGCSENDIECKEKGK